MEETLRKVILIFTGLIFLCFFLPVILTNPFMEVSQVVPKEEKSQEENKQTSYDYGEYTSIKLWHAKTETIEEIKLEDYLYGVVSAEMPASFETEALKAQAIVARTYTIYKLQTSEGKHGAASICDDSTCCQAWISKEDRFKRWEEAQRESNWNKIVNAVDSTKGRIVTYEGKAINAFFHSNSGGSTEIPLNVWGGSGYPYLQTVQTAGEDAYSQYQSEVELSKEEVIEKLKQNHPEVEINFELEDAIQVKEYTESGRVKTITFGNVNLSGVEARTLFGLKSTNFTIGIVENTIKFSVIGYGHGVGMSQTGADSLAKQGKNCEEIIHHFYTGVEIINM